MSPDAPTPQRRSDETWLARLIRFSLDNPLIVVLFVVLCVVWGYMVAPFHWSDRFLPRDPAAVDAIPDIGENQQIIFTDWPGRSPQDIEDQITYPLMTSLMGIRGVKTVRSFSMFGFSSIYVVFEDEVEFERSRQRALEKLASLPAGLLPEGVQPRLGPDSTALGQVFWYTLEGRDPEGNPTGGWDLQDLRSIQDWHVRYALLAADGVSEVASIGGHVREYQIDVDPDAMRAANVTLMQVYDAVRGSNQDVGARTIEVNSVEYVVRGLGLIDDVDDLRRTVVAVRESVPITIDQIANVTTGPALRRGVLDKGGAEVVGGVVVVRYGENPLSTIEAVKEKIAEITPGLPRKTLEDGTVSQVRIVPFYDRTGLILETLGTLKTALAQQILVTIIVILVMVRHLRSSALIAGLLPLAVLMSFIGMKLAGIEANIVALSGIAIAIGTMVDMGIIICENILQRLEEAPEDETTVQSVYRAAHEVGGAVVTAAATTIVGFLPVFTMEAAEGKLFRPLAFTKTFALFASLIVAVLIIPPLASRLFVARPPHKWVRRVGGLLAIILGVHCMVTWEIWIGVAAFVAGLWWMVGDSLPHDVRRKVDLAADYALAGWIVIVLANYWLPLGPARGIVRNALFVFAVMGSLLLAFGLYVRVYGHVLGWCLDHKKTFLALPAFICLLGLNIWLGFGTVFGWLPQSVRTWKPVSTVAHAFPGLGREFMPSLDEGAFLWMPTTMPHASIGEALDIMRKQDMAIQAIPEVRVAVGKLGRAETPLDPAPVSMIETIIEYEPRYLLDVDGDRARFLYDSSATDLFRRPDGTPVPAPDGKAYRVQGKYERDEDGNLIPDEDGRPFRLWRLPLEADLNEGRDPWPGIDRPDDIWSAIVEAGEVPGSTSAPKLQPIETRIVMLQSGMRAPMGIKVKGPDLATIERVGIEIEALLKEIPSVAADAVSAERIVGKPYLEIEIDRAAIARYGMRVADVQRVIEMAIGGKPLTTTIEGRERYPVRARYMRELRDSIESLDRILVPGAQGVQIPLAQLATTHYVRGPQMIRNEDTFLVGYVLFDRQPGWAEVEVVEQAREYLDSKIADGTLEIPEGVSYAFAGSFENQVRAARKLRVVLPLALFIIFLILYLKFRAVSTTAFVFTGVAVAWAGGFILVWLYGQSWFLDFAVFGVGMRDLFNVVPVNLSVAIWVGFLALFGIATDDGVVMASYIQDHLGAEDGGTVRERVVTAGLRRIRPCMMTTATTTLALVPVLTSVGRGSDILVPMAIPGFGGMMIQILTTLVVPVLYCTHAERLDKSRRSG